MKKKRKTRRTLLQVREPYRYISILSDYGFKKTFGNEKNTHFLRRAVQALIQSNVPIKTVDFVKNERPGITADGRGSLFDVICKDENGKVYIIEMQLTEVEHFFQRAKFYAIHVFNTMVQKGGFYKFDKLKPIFVISFLAENAFPSKHYYQVGQIKNQYGEVMDEQTTYVVIELGKWHKKVEDIETDLDKIIYIMKATESVTKKQNFTEPAFFQEEWLKSILKELDLVRMTPEERMLYEMEMVRRAHEEMVQEKRKAAAIKEVEEEKAVIMEEKAVILKEKAVIMEEKAVILKEKAVIMEEKTRALKQIEQLEKQKETVLEQAKKEKETVLEQAEKEKETVLEQAEKEKEIALEQAKKEKEIADIKKLLLSKMLSTEQISSIMEIPMGTIEALYNELKKEGKL